MIQVLEWRRSMRIHHSMIPCLAYLNADGSSSRTISRASSISSHPDEVHVNDVVVETVRSENSTPRRGASPRIMTMRTPPSSRRDSFGKATPSPSLPHSRVSTPTHPTARHERKVTSSLQQEWNDWMDRLGHHSFQVLAGSDQCPRRRNRQERSDISKHSGDPWYSQSVEGNPRRKRRLGKLLRSSLVVIIIEEYSSSFRNTDRIWIVLRNPIENSNTFSKHKSKNTKQLFNVIYDSSIRLNPSLHSPSPPLFSSVNRW